MNMAESVGNPRPMRLRVPIQVRFGDLDALGHINNANYLAYFEVGRMAYLNQVLGVYRLQEIGFILAEMTVRYKAPGRLEAPLTLCLRVGELRNSSFTFEYELVETETGKLIATGTSVQVWYDYQRGQVVRIPAAIRERMREFDGLEAEKQGG